MENLILSDESYKIVGRQFLYLKDFYNSPCKSSSFGIFLVESPDFGPLEIFNITDIYKKYVKIQIQGKIILFPLLHSDCSS